MLLNLNFFFFSFFWVVFTLLNKCLQFVESFPQPCEVHSVNCASIFFLGSIFTEKWAIWWLFDWRHCSENEKWCVCQSENKNFFCQKKQRTRLPYLGITLGKTMFLTSPINKAVQAQNMFDLYRNASCKILNEYLGAW